MSLKGVAIFSMIIFFITGCTVGQDNPIIVRNNFDEIDLSNYQTCKGVFLVEDTYDIGISVFVAGDVANGEIAVGDTTELNGQKITVKGIEGNKKKWDKVTKPYRVGLDFGRQIADGEYVKGNLICFN